MAGDLRWHVPYFLRFRGGLSRWLRSPRQGDHGRHPELHRPHAGDSDQRGHCGLSLSGVSAALMTGKAANAFVQGRTRGAARAKPAVTVRLTDLIWRMRPTCETQWYTPRDQAVSKAIRQRMVRDHAA